MKNAYKIGLSAIIVTTVALSIFYPIVRSNLKTEIFEHPRTAAQSRANHIETFLGEHRQTVESLGAGAVFKGLLATNKNAPGYSKKLERVASRVNDVIKAHKEISELSLMDKNGIVAASTDQVSVGSDRSADKTYLKRKEAAYIRDVHISETSGMPAIDIAAPILLNGESLGVIVADLDIEDLSKINGIYLPPQPRKRTISEVIYYAELEHLNAVVLHVKDPRGWIYWQSQHPIAREIGAVHYRSPVERNVKHLNSEGIWTIAKIDIFQDSLLAKKYPEMGVLDTQTGGLWANKNGLHWVNPYDRRVWDYNIALCKELVEIGFDEIQFDYTRFPSDGDLRRIRYPIVLDGLTKAQCIGEFLKAAYAELKPLGVIISIDVFGLTAWKKEDFGVGQVLEEIVPHVDVICPMLYPSHFPVGFLGYKNPGHYPRQIVESSMKQIKKRTNKKIRPWIQGFWYKTEDIVAQINGVLSTGTSSWTVWNPSGRYAMTYRAIAERMNTTFPEPKFYPSLAELHNNNDRFINGNARTIHFTNYREGYTILSLEESKDGHKSAYSTPIEVINTLDEAVMDRILLRRNIPFRRLTNKATKEALIADLLCKDLNIDPHRMRAVPIYIDWREDCRFTLLRLAQHISIEQEWSKIATSLWGP